MTLPGLGESRARATMAYRALRGQLRLASEKPVLHTNEDAVQIIDDASEAMPVRSEAAMCLLDETLVGFAAVLFHKTEDDRHTNIQSFVIMRPEDWSALDVVLEHTRADCGMA